MYDFMSKTSSSTSNYTPPFKMVTINEGDNDSNEADWKNEKLNKKIRENKSPLSLFFIFTKTLI